jgi:hypothetical protein
MSGSSTLFSLLEGANNPSIDTPESTESVAKSGDAALFVSLLEQYQPDGAEQAPGAAEISVVNPLVPAVLPPAVSISGKALPQFVIPEDAVALPPSRAAALADPDGRLEDFAVGMGIDRELARLLLQETAANDRPRVPMPVGVVPETVARREMMLPTVDGAMAETELAELPTSRLPMPVGVVVEPLVRREMMLPTVPEPAVRREVMLQASQAPVAIASAVAALSDEDVLRWRSVNVRQLPSRTDEVMKADAVASPSDDVGEPMRHTETEFAAASAVLRGFTLERPLRRSFGEPASTPLPAVAAASSVTPNPVMVAALPLSSVSVALPETPLLPSTDPQPLRLPDPTLAHEQRVEQFAQQVAQRLLQQIRQDRWTVSLQLDPQHLGPLDIELELEGNKVSANLGVANAEVRNLLESALPKLRESLDSAGLSLANWSFAQSSLRDQRERAETLVALARASRSTSATGAVDMTAISSAQIAASDRAVDLYV